VDKIQRSVLEFMIKARQPVCTGSAVELGASLIAEEALETVDALGYNISSKVGGKWELKQKPSNAVDLVEAVDGMCDTQYVMYWTANMLGIDLEEAMKSVCANNLLKVVDPQFHENGKVKKPEGHQPPDIAGLLGGVNTFFLSIVVYRFDGPHIRSWQCDSKTQGLYQEKLKEASDGFLQWDTASGGLTVMLTGWKELVKELVW